MAEKADLEVTPSQRATKIRTIYKATIGEKDRNLLEKIYNSRDKERTKWAG